MLDRLLNQVNILEKGLDASWLNNDAIASNIANVDTPGYQAKRVSFESVFQDILKSGSSFSSRPAAYKAFAKDTSGASIAPGADSATGSFSDDGCLSDVAEFNRQACFSTRSTLRMDGNNVDIDYEMTELAKNTILYDALTYAVNEEAGRLKLIISEGK